VITLVGVSTITAAYSTAPTIGAAINGSGGLVVAGAGQLNLTGSNHYTGGTNVSAGTLLLNSSSALGQGLLTVSTGAALLVDASQSITSTTTNFGSMTIAAGQSFNVSGAGVVFNQSAGTLAVNGGILLSGTTFNDLGGTITATVAMLGSSTVVINPSGPGGAFSFTGPSAVATVNVTTTAVAIPVTTAIRAQSTTGLTSLTINATACYAAITAISAPSSTATVNLGTGSTFAIYSGLTLSAVGTPSAPITLNAMLINGPGAVTNINTSVNHTGSILDQGGFNIAAGAVYNAPGTFNLSGGNLMIYGAFNTTGGTFDDTSGYLFGNVSMGSVGTVGFGTAAVVFRRW
jgi:fibronectin-binding autotransporter adhesin